MLSFGLQLTGNSGSRSELEGNITFGGFKDDLSGIVVRRRISSGGLGGSGSTSSSRPANTNALQALSSSLSNSRVLSGSFSSLSFLFTVAKHLVGTSA